MERKFNLSESIFSLSNDGVNQGKSSFIPKEDVKEFIRLLKESLRDQHFSDEPDDNLYLSVKKIKGRINKLAGDDLK